MDCAKSRDRLQHKRCARKLILRKRLDSVAPQGLWGKCAKGVHCAKSRDRLRRNARARSAELKLTARVISVDGGLQFGDGEGDVVFKTLISLRLNKCRGSEGCGLAEAIKKPPLMGARQQGRWRSAPARQVNGFWVLVQFRQVRLIGKLRLEVGRDAVAALACYPPCCFEISKHCGETAAR